jgi:hypothetical protein
LLKILIVGLNFHLESTGNVKFTGEFGCLSEPARKDYEEPNCANWQTHFYNRIRAPIFDVKKHLSYQAFNTWSVFASRELSWSDSYDTQET